MQKILVTTDLLEDSKAGMQFAIQLSMQNNAQLTFFHSFYILKPTTWSVADVATFEDVEESKLQKQLNKFVDEVYKEMNVVNENKRCVIDSSVMTDSEIVEYAQSHDFDFICISTKGAGTFQRFFGTNTSHIITHSLIPVIAVPQNYHNAPISSILYASDLLHLEKELPKVVNFAKTFDANINILHINYATELDSKKIAADKLIGEYNNPKIHLNIVDAGFTDSLITNIEAMIDDIRPSILVMFTEQHRNFFEKMFLASKAAGYSFNAKVPLLVFHKE